MNDVLQRKKHPDIMTEMVEQRKKTLIQESVVLAVVPVLGYLYAFLFEVGVCGYFHIPVDLIEVDLKQFFIAIFVLLGTTWMIVPIVNVIYMTVETAQLGPRGRLLLMQLPWLVLFVAYFLLVREEWKIWMAILLLWCLVISALDFGLPLLTGKNLSTYDEKLLNQEKIESQTPGLLSLFARRYDAKTVIGVGGLLLLGSLFHTAGRSYAMHKEHFFVSGGNSPKVLLRVYRDYVIAVPVDIKKQEIIPQIDTSVVSELHGYQLRHIGRLKARESDE